MNPIVVIQARMGSQRLPGKSLMDLNGKPVLQHVVERCREADIGRVVVATTWSSPDREILRLCRDLDVACFRGHPSDVLKRYADTVALYGGDPVVRVTADCPFLSPMLLRKVLERLGEGFDYSGVRGAPDGYHAEAMTAWTLRVSNAKAKIPFDREHVVTYALGRPQIFRIGWVESDIVGEPVTLDTVEDLERLRRMAA